VYPTDRVDEARQFFDKCRGIFVFRLGRLDGMLVVGLATVD
jgi:hypothetical protein